MGYSLGDDKESFDIFERTENTLIEIGEQLKKNNWNFDADKGIFSKDNKDVAFELDTDHINCIYMYSSSIDWEIFCGENYEFEPVYGRDDNIDCVVTYVSSNTNISKIIRQLENSKDKSKDEELDMY